MPAGRGGTFGNGDSHARATGLCRDTRQNPRVQGMLCKSGAREPGLETANVRDRLGELVEGCRVT